MTFIHKAIFTDKAMPGPGTTADFFAGEAAMTITQISRASLLKDGGFGWDLVPLPAGPKGKYSVIGQAGIGVLKKGAHAAAAADFLAFFTNPANSVSSPVTSRRPAPRCSPPTPSPRPTRCSSPSSSRGRDRWHHQRAWSSPPHRTGRDQSDRPGRAGPLWKADADIQTVLNGVCTAIAPLLAK